MGIHSRPDEYPRHPEFDGSPLLVGDEVQLAGYQPDQWFVICEIRVVGYGFDGQLQSQPPEVWLSVLGMLSTVILPEDVLGRRSR